MNMFAAPAEAVSVDPAPVLVADAAGVVTNLGEAETSANLLVGTEDTAGLLDAAIAAQTAAGDPTKILDNLNAAQAAVKDVNADLVYLNNDLADAVQAPATAVNPAPAANKTENTVNPFDFITNDD
ncbi:MAG: hypothetical protein K6E49_05585 [Lachnospiraceae bacterium]|nr:hypothetical protein [Lachnospiraceae bacterium]